MDDEQYEFEFIQGSIVAKQTYEFSYDEDTKRLEIQFDDGVDAELAVGYKIRLLNPRTSGGVFGVFDADGLQNETGLKVSNATQYVFGDEYEQVAIATVSYETLNVVETGWGNYLDIF